MQRAAQGAPLAECRWADSNHQPRAYESPALPLSYTGPLPAAKCTMRRHTASMEPEGSALVLRVAEDGQSENEQDQTAPRC